MKISMPDRGPCGRWQGTYSYDPDSSGKLPASPVRFELTITQTWLQSVLGHFSGTVTDDPAQHDIGTGTIRGNIHQTRLRFAKYMPVAYVMSNGRPLRLSEHLAKLGHSGIPDYPHVPIQYAGILEQPSRASGRWRIQPSQIVLPGGLRVTTSETTGTWEMARVD